jgi:hypothetical protein
MKIGVIRGILTTGRYKTKDVYIELGDSIETTFVHIGNKKITNCKSFHINYGVGEYPSITLELYSRWK